MNFNWVKKKMTVVIIPENAHRSVIQLRMAHAVLLGAAILLLALALWALMLWVQHARSEKAKLSLQSELSGRTMQYDAALADKDQTIQQLQSELVNLSQQAKTVQQQLEEVKKLENDLKSIAPDALAKGTASAAPAGGQEAAAAAGRGGTLIELGEPKIHVLTEQTAAEFSGLTAQAGELQKSLNSVKQEVLEKQQALRTTPTIWPVDSRTITSPFGYRIDPLTNRPSYHSGLDIGEKENAPVRVTADGVVVSTGFDSSRGNNILVDHSGGIRTWYMHLNRILVKTGDKVSKGDRIGWVGSTGRSTGPHLHYEVLKNGQSADPRSYLNDK